MKLILRDYLASLKERDELDAILPDLLSELGYTVYSRPGRGTVQHGVDIAALSPATDGPQRVYLFTVKQGDLTRQSWNSSDVQSLRPTLASIVDGYIPTRIPKQFRGRDIVICVCLGGDMQEQVRTEVTGYFNANTKDGVSFEEWNGDKIAGLLLNGVLREELLPKPLRSHFQKAVAMLDEPDVAYEHFKELTLALGRNSTDEKTRLRSARQLYVCLWVLFVWARDVDNLDAPYRCSELAALQLWHQLRPYIAKKSRMARDMTRVFNQLTQLHLVIAMQYLKTKVIAEAHKKDALAMAVRTRHAVDINLRLFDLLGRVAMTGLWLHWLASRTNDLKQREQTQAWRNHLIAIINNNAVLHSPICDQHAIEINLAFLLFASTNTDPSVWVPWLDSMAMRVHFAVRTGGLYPCTYTDYADLAAHPRDRSDEYLKETTAGSILLPLLAAWSLGTDLRSAVDKFADLQGTDLQHCTMQLWLPDDETENRIYAGQTDHGTALCDLKFPSEGSRLLDVIAQACSDQPAFYELSANRTGYWPILLMACRHYRLPVPPQFWIEIVRPSRGGETTA